MTLQKTLKKYNDWINHDDQYWIRILSVIGFFSAIIAISLTAIHFLK